MYLLNWRMWLAVAILVAYPITYMKGRSDGLRLERAESALAVAQADHEARAMEQRRQDHVVDAQRAAATRAARLVADAASARDAALGLRDTLDAVQRASAQSADAARVSVAALADVFGQCTREYQALAEVADRHASDSLTLQQGWPR